MAASGFTPISLYYSTTASAVPTSGNLANGELGLNIADMKLYAKNSAGTVTLLASNAGASGSVTSVSGTGTVNGLTLTGTVTTSGSLTLGGTLSGVSLTSQVSGTLPTANGGTNLTSFTSGGVVYASSTSALATGSALTFNGTSSLVVSTSDTTGTALNLANTSTGGYSWNIFSGGSVASLAPVGSLIFRDSTNGATRMVISPAGNVGIGTASPSSKLHLSDINTTLTIQGTLGTGGTHTIGATGANNTNLSIVGASQIYLTANGADRFIIGSAGQFGIGAGNSTGSSGQVLTSQGSGAAPTWATAAAGGTTMLFAAFSATGETVFAGGL